LVLDEAEVERRVSLLSEGLRKRGLRLTPQRLQVARVIAESESHPDVESIFRQVREHVPTVSLDTVYRTMATLVELGLVNRVSVPGGSARYDADISPHHHFVCVECGLIGDVHARALEQIDIPHEAARYGIVQLVKVQFRGICDQCVTKPRKGVGQ